MIPKVKVSSDNELSSNKYQTGDKSWSVTRLIEYCKEKKYPVFKMPLVGIDLSFLPWELANLDDFVYHVKRMDTTDLKHPIILDNFGRVCDGFHRLAKAILLGKTEIDAIRIEEMPKPDAYAGNEE